MCSSADRALVSAGEAALFAFATVDRYDIESQKICPGAEYRAFSMFFLEIINVGVRVGREDTQSFRSVGVDSTLASTQLAFQNQIRLFDTISTHINLLLSF